MFHIEKELGEGAYGKVYKVKCLKSTAINSASISTPADTSSKLKSSPTSRDKKRTNLSPIIKTKK
jgi:hypothetical protein